MRLGRALATVLSVAFVLQTFPPARVLAGDEEQSQGRKVLANAWLVHLKTLKPGKRALVYSLALKTWHLNQNHPPARQTLFSDQITTSWSFDPQSQSFPLRGNVLLDHADHWMPDLSVKMKFPVELADGIPRAFMNDEGTALLVVEARTIDEGDKERTEFENKAHAFAWAINLKSLQAGREVTVCLPGTADFELEDGHEVALECDDESSACTARYSMKIGGDRFPVDVVVSYACRCGEEKLNGLEWSRRDWFPDANSDGHVSEDGNWLVFAAIERHSRIYK